MAKPKTNQREEEKYKKKNKKHGILKKILLILLLVFIVLIGFIAYKTHQNGGGMTGLLVTLVGNDEDTIKELEPLQVLLMGMSTDQRSKVN